MCGCGDLSRCSSVDPRAKRLRPAARCGRPNIRQRPPAVFGLSIGVNDPVSSRALQASFPRSLRAAFTLASRLVALGALVYVAVVVLLYFRQESLLFMPSPLSQDERIDMPGVSEVNIPVDGATLHALHFRQPNAKGVVFFLHGNAGNVKTWLTSTEFYRRTGYDLFLLDYRGYGKSTGRIESEAQLHADVRAAWDHVAREYAARSIVIYGRSLGTGPATRLASEVTAALLVLVSPYSSLIDVAREHYPWVPGAVLRYPMRTDLWLPKVRMPVFLVHGERDDLIDPAHTQRLRALRPDADVLLLPEAGHNDVHRFGMYTDALAERFLRL